MIFSSSSSFFLFLSSKLGFFFFLVRNLFPIYNFSVISVQISLYFSSLFLVLLPWRHKSLFNIYYYYLLFFESAQFFTPWIPIICILYLSNLFFESLFSHYFTAPKFGENSYLLSIVPIYLFFSICVSYLHCTFKFNKYFRFF